MFSLPVTKNNDKILLVKTQNILVDNCYNCNRTLINDVKHCISADCQTQWDLPSCLYGTQGNHSLEQIIKETCIVILVDTDDMKMCRDL